MSLRRTALATILHALALITATLVSFAATASPAAEGAARTITATDWPKDILQGELPPTKNAKLILVDVWASWCEPCRQSLPFYDEMQSQFSKDGVRFVTVSADEDLAEAKGFLKQVKFHLPAAWDKDRALTKKLGLSAIPALVVLKPNGEILAIEHGYTAAAKKKFPDKIKEWLKTAG